MKVNNVQIQKLKAWNIVLDHHEDLIFDYTSFSIHCIQIMSSLNCSFGPATILWSQRLKNRKYSVWLQKRVKNSFQQVFPNGDPYIVGDVICYFLIMNILSRQKLQNEKYSFSLQKGVKIQSDRIFWSATSTLRIV